MEINSRLKNPIKLLFLEKNKTKQKSGRLANSGRTARTGAEESAALRPLDGDLESSEFMRSSGALIYVKK
jgi:hypothetical protein